MIKQSPYTEIENRLEELKDIPPRNPHQAARGRANFLSEAAEYRQAVSIPPKVRQKGWIFITNRKEKYAMNALVSFVLATALILGGGATAVAAQDDLPNQPLYPVKMMTENIKLSLTGNPQLQANLLMNMAQTRVEEMATLVENGNPVPARVHDRLQQQIQQTLMLATDMDDAALTQTLLQLRERLQTQERIMKQLQTHVNVDFDPQLTKTRLMLQTRLQLVDEGLADPQSFRYMMTNEKQYGQDGDGAPEPNKQGEPGFHQNDQSGEPPVEPGSGNSNGQGYGTPGGQNPTNSQNGSNGNGSSNEQPDGQNPDNTQGGNNSGSGNNNGSGSRGNK